MVLNYYVKEPLLKVQHCIIWMHGLGADASDMSSLADQLQLPPIGIRHVFLNAPVRAITINNGMHMPAWYDIYNLHYRSKEDKEGILASQQEIIKFIDAQINQGLLANKIWLAGFSQGGAMALHTALHYNEPLAGVISLSAYLPLAAESKPKMCSEIPIFFAYGTEDEIVLPIWSKLTLDWLLAHNYSNIKVNSYPMEHMICREEVADLSAWLTNLMPGNN